MTFKENISEKEYNTLYNKLATSFMQSYKWGKFNEVSRHQTAYYIGMYNKDELVAAALLLKSVTKEKFVYFYSPRGFILDYTNTKVLKEFTNYVKDFLKKEKAAYLVIDPEIKYQDIDELGNPIKNDNNNYKLFEEFINLGYTHTGFNKFFENTQPRYTFIIDTTKDIEELEKNINKSIMKKIRKTYEYDMELKESTNTKLFHELISINSERDGFIPYKESYYENALKMMDGIYKMFELSINPKALYQKLKEKLEKEKDLHVDAKARLEKELSILENYKNEDNIVLCSQIIAQNKSKVYTLYIGNNELGQELYAVPRMYLEMIKYTKENNIPELDLFGTMGDPTTEHKNLIGIHKFKANFGGTYTEFVGEFHLIISPFKRRLIKTFGWIHKKVYRFKYKLKKH